MDNQDSLLGFLKKKSLFNQSPVRYPAGKRSRSKSKDGKESIIRIINDKDLEEYRYPVNRLNTNFSGQNLQKQSSKGLFLDKNYQQAAFQDNRINRTNSNYLESQQNNGRLKQSSQRFNFTSQKSNKNNNFMTGVASYSTSFQSARVQSAQCLQTLSLKLKTEISNVNYRIDQFRDNMQKVLNQELKLLREQILHLVDDAFKESQRTIRDYMKMQEQKLAIDLLNIRQQLQKEYVKVVTMHEQIGQAQWRKVAGQILATQLQKNVEELIKKGKNTEIRRWQMKNLSGQRLKPLQKQLRDLARLKE